jgi:hypothetical protein
MVRFRDSGVLLTLLPTSKHKHKFPQVGGDGADRSHFTCPTEAF